MRFQTVLADHRGTVSSPGRVVTLIPHAEYVSTHYHLDPHHHPSAESICWGIAYQIPADKAESVREHLDHREKNGYEVFEEDVYHPDYMGGQEPIVKGALVYVATSQNESFLGPASEVELARQIAAAKGPSGWNADYLLGLSRSMKILSPNSPDHHLESLETEVLNALRSSTTSSAPSNTEASLSTSTSTLTLPSSTTVTTTSTAGTIGAPGSISDSDLDALRELV
ncbi:hypothetical protein HK097_007832, partial [Rhizophlyctis rosea]